MSNGGKRPRPAITLDTAPWWDALGDGKVLIQVCVECAHRQHPPEPACMACGSFDLAWITASGAGTIYSFVVCHEPELPGFTAPYVVAVATLREGTRLIANLVDCTPGAVRVGSAITVDTIRVDEDLVLPVFRLAQDPGEVAATAGVLG